MFGIPTCHTSTNLRGLLVNSQVSGRLCGVLGWNRLLAPPPAEGGAVRSGPDGNPPGKSGGSGGS